MPLTPIELPTDRARIPESVRNFIGRAKRRIQIFRSEERIPAFVTSDYHAVYATLRALIELDLATGDLFCEWGSGFGVVSCLAAMLGYDSHGIEIEESLVNAAQELADDFDLAVTFIQGSFIPAGGKAITQSADGFAWLTVEEGSAYDGLDLAAQDFAVIFAFPWPDEEEAIARLFERFACEGSILVTYHSDGNVCVRRKSV